jgi:hypothetical protein
MATATTRGKPGSLLIMRQRILNREAALEGGGRVGVDDGFVSADLLSGPRVLCAGQTYGQDWVLDLERARRVAIGSDRGKRSSSSSIRPDGLGCRHRAGGAGW